MSVCLSIVNIYIFLKLLSFIYLHSFATRRIKFHRRDVVVNSYFVFFVEMLLTCEISSICECVGIGLLFTENVFSPVLVDWFFILILIKNILLFGFLVTLISMFSSLIKIAISIYS